MLHCHHHSRGVVFNRRFIRKLMVLGAISVGLALVATVPHALADERDQPVRGVVRAHAEAAIATELVAIVRQAPFREGQSFKQGDVLVSFDCSRYRAELKAAQSAHAAESITLRNNRQLLKHQAAGRNDVAVSEARTEKARAEAEAIKTRLAYCDIKAPFDGRVVERAINEHEIPRAGEPLMRIVATGKKEIDIIVPSTWLTWLEQGMRFSFAVDETDETLAAQVDRIGAAVDPVSKTVKIIGSFADQTEKVLPGMSGSATFARSGS